MHARRLPNDALEAAQRGSTQKLSQGFHMFLATAQRGWLFSVLISVVLVLLAAVVANKIAFRHRFGNALLKTFSHAVLFGGAGLAWWYYAKKTPTPSIVDFIVT